MAREIVLTTVPIAAEETLQRVMEHFESQHRIHVNIQWVPWEFYRQEFTNIALHHLPADVLIAGTPITSDLIAMTVLRPFAPAEIQRLGGEAAFLSARWRSGMRPNASEVWALPLVTDLRVLYYNRKWLAKAGVDEAGAFASPQQFEATIRALHDCGVTLPWHMVTERYNVLHRVASWIWAYGGDLFSADGKRAIFHEAEALEGIRAYFRLAQYTAVGLAGQNGYDLIRAGQAAVAIEDAFYLYDKVPAEIGCAPVPGGSYVGGGDMMIWKHTRNESAALELVDFLSRPEVTAQLLPDAPGALPIASHYLPVRMSQLNALAAGPNPLAQGIVQANLTGRTFPCVPMIGLTEERLGSALASITQEVLANPRVDIEPLLQQRIVSLGKRMNLSLGSIS